tara:strand:- start:1417 stop:1692 length:276 start_codon:yes stop_codon:yes gene_type:complete
MEEPTKKYYCDFCTGDIEDLEGHTFCPSYCFSDSLGSYPYGVLKVGLELCSNPDCFSCLGKGYVKCEECDGDGWLWYSNDEDGPEWKSTTK